MNTFSVNMMSTDGTVITITTGSYSELLDIISKMEKLGHKTIRETGTKEPQRQQTPNKPDNVPACRHHPDVGMGHDKQNPGQYYCRGKVDGKWCGYKASKDGVIRLSILDVVEDDLDEQIKSIFSTDHIDF